ncbi:maleylpyruvate isomerase family mycothiol-dependent enzyme [Lentzea sp. NPDC051213]|uniref:maleylpyruvate isomerase family mycothiol-dependent enzyme n=1 Tax=Lentzea sp. NPDC051213 TaxID=3364126 RepID=UPI0037B1F453
MGILSYERCRAEIINQTALLAASLEGFDLAKQVPACPDWSVNQLVRHVGYALEWVDDMIRAGQPGIDLAANKGLDVSAYTGETADTLGPWLAERASSLAEALETVSPDEPIAMIAPGLPGPRMWSRRMVHEMVMHRWDVETTLGVEFSADPEVLSDTVTEWTAVALPFAFVRQPAETAPLLGPGNTVHLHATDAELELVIDFTGPRPVVREGHEKAAVAVRGPLLDLVLAVYRRRSVAGLEVFGDVELLELFLDRIRF